MPEDPAKIIIMQNTICWCRCSTSKLSRRVTMPKDFI
ncbi:hypothetical protein V6Z12_A07G248900 [Gossypium hirsutum]